MHAVRILLFVTALCASSISLAQEKTMLAKHGIIPDLPKEFTVRGEAIVIMHDNMGRQVLVSYIRCPNSDKVEVMWWYPGDAWARRIDCSGNVSSEDLRSHASWIVPVPRK
ncbi:MAG: hypothetical protein NUW00_01255 [Candidatus Kaiserbacteria bacterium]|nr:hypothetical protein [Candidatus Kaiserbacteria bacterium]